MFCQGNIKISGKYCASVNESAVFTALSEKGELIGKQY
jgi:hypothetical protein